MCIVTKCLYDEFAILNLCSFFKRDGCGTFTVKNGICYEGHWMYDLKDGTGTLTFPNGDKYEGAFIEDKVFKHL